MDKILIIEDDPDIQELLFSFINDAGYDVIIAGDGIDGITEFNKDKFDLVLLDIMLPKMDGFAVCELIRKESDIPIIMLTALENEENQLKGFRLSIDDYITKPFSMPVLLQKIAAVLRRSNKPEKLDLLKYRDLTLDLDGYRVYINKETVDLTQREFELLKELLTHQGKVMTRQVLLNRLWEYEFFGDERVVDTHIKNIRKKTNINYIETIRGVGYRIDKIY